MNSSHLVVVSFFRYSMIMFIKMLASTFLEYTKNRYSMLAIIVENT